MKAISDIERIMAKVPAHIKPLPREVIEQGMREDEIRLYREHQLRKSEAIVGKSGIPPSFLKCTFENYACSCRGQYVARDAASSYAENFAEHSGNGSGFLFMGSCGTGKNHLASAIAVELMRRNYIVVMVSVMDLMARVREVYSGKFTEEQILADLCRPELLILDEIGLQRDTLDERLWLTRIIDKRLLARKPTGFITNLDTEGLKAMLGERAFDRLRDAVSVRVKFNWPSHRGKGVDHAAA